MRYVESRLEQVREDSMYRLFISEGIKTLTKNTAIYEGSEVLNYNFYEYLEMLDKPEDEREADEIIDSISRKLAEMGDN